MGKGEEGSNHGFADAHERAPSASFTSVSLELHIGEAPRDPSDPFLEIILRKLRPDSYVTETAERIGPW